MEEIQTPIEVRWALVLSERNRLLASSDWTQLPDAVTNPVIWAIWRQQLRDITDTFDTPEEVVFPNPPPLELNSTELIQLTRKINSIEEAKLSSQLKTMTAQEAVNYIETNATNFATLKPIVKLMARILVALRDATWPNLPES